MPNHKSAEKRLRQNEKRRAHNQQYKASVRTAIKKVKAAVDEGKLDEARELLKDAEKKIASATNKRMYHKNNGARKVSRLASLVNNAAS